VTTVEVAGREFHYLRSGSGQPLLLIQGLSGTHLAWGRPFLEALGTSFECIVYDNRGMGLSGRVEEPFTIAELAADALGLLDRLELERAHVLGISMGGMIAQELALAAPERLLTLTAGRELLRRCRLAADGPGGLPAPRGCRGLGRSRASGARELGDQPLRRLPR
jgi:pimeloyl-ACP methyl ester carboxylesterase